MSNTTLPLKVQRRIDLLEQWKKEAILLLNKIDTYACSHPEIKSGMSKVDFTIERAKKFDATTQKGPMWISPLVRQPENFPDDWFFKHWRYASDYYKLDTDLFEVKDGGLVKKGGSGRLEWHEVEWLDESRVAAQLCTIDQLKDILLSDIDSPVFTHSPQFRKHFDYIKSKFIEIVGVAAEQKRQ